MTKKIYAVIGDPIAHSLSPAMHNAAFRALKMDAEYIAVHVLADGLESFAAEARKKLAGFNITVPHKKGIIPFLDVVNQEAALAGSVNTVLIRENQLSGCSTDGYGLEAALSEAFGYTLKNNAALFIGCGGAARAAAFHFASKGLKNLYILNRTLATAEGLCAELTTHYPGLECTAAALNNEEAVRTALKQVPVAIQCTSLGLKPDDPPPLLPEWLPQGIALFDTIYKPTALLQYAQAHGIAHANGSGMLLHQGAKSFELWTGIKPPLDVMRAELP